MTLADQLSWGASVVSIAGMWAYGNGGKWGPIIALSSQAFWFALAYVEGLHGLFVCNTVFALVHIRNLIKLTRRPST